MTFLQNGLRTLLSASPTARPATGDRVFDRNGRFQETLDLASRAAASASEESLVVDDRSALRPSQIVEDRLSQKLGEASLPVSHLQMRSMLGHR